MTSIVVLLRAKPETINEAIAEMGKMKAEGLTVISAVKVHRSSILGYNVMLQVELESGRFDFNSFTTWLKRQPAIEQFCYPQMDIFTSET